MVRYKIAPSYSADYLETERPQPLTDNKIELLIQEVLAGQADKDITDQVYVNFKKDTPYGWKAHTYTNVYYTLFNHCKNEIKLIFECR